MKLFPLVRAAWLSCLAAFLCFVPSALLAQPKPGIIQITCEPGVIVFLDGEVKGETSRDLGGMVLRGVAPGTRRLKFVKEGFDPAEGSVVVEPGGVASFKVQPFAREMKVKQSGKAGDSQITQKTGRLLIQSLPIQCTIMIPGLQLPRSDKTNDLWELEEVKIGEFEATFEGAGRRLTQRIVIREKALTHLFVDFLEGKIEDRSPPPPPPPSAAQRAAAVDEPRVVAPAVTQRAAPPPPPAPAETPEQAIARLQKKAALLTGMLEAFDRTLAGGALGLDDTIKAGADRTKVQGDLDTVRSEIVRQQRRAAEAREQAFRADYAKLGEILRGDIFPVAAKRAAWADLAKRWQIADAPAEPQQVEWREGRPVIVWRGSLAVTSNRAGASVQVSGPGGARLAATELPAAFPDVPVGRYRVTVRLPGWDTFEREVEIARDAAVAVAAEFVGGSLVIASEPAGAEVVRDGKVIGVTPLTLGDERPGSVGFSLRAEGYMPKRTASVVVGGRETKIVVSLEKFADRSLADLALDLIWLKPGTFSMGSTNGSGNERPVTQATLTHGFWLGKTEVTQAQWQAVMGNNPSGRKGETLPVENVSWDDAIAFCRKLTERERAAGRLPEGYSYTLPIEAQWEYACRAGTTGDHAGDLNAMAWYSANAGGQTRPVATKQANAWGLHDMHGNVWEWCLDWYGNYPGGSVSDPKGAPSGSDRVCRGGSWRNVAAHCRSAFRIRDSPGGRNDDLGFRLALSFSP